MHRLGATPTIAVGAPRVRCYGRMTIRHPLVEGSANVARNVIDDPNEDIVAKAKKDRAEKRGPFGRIALFLRQVVNELSKVVTPTRRELINYTLLVLVFVVIMMALVSGLDLLFGALVSYVFGDGTAVTGG